MQLRCHFLKRLWPCVLSLKSNSIAGSQFSSILTVQRATVGGGRGWAVPWGKEGVAVIAPRKWGGKELRVISCFEKLCTCLICMREWCWGMEEREGAVGS